MKTSTKEGALRPSNRFWQMNRFGEPLPQILQETYYEMFHGEVIEIKRFKGGEVKGSYKKVFSTSPERYSTSLSWKELL